MHNLNFLSVRELDNENMRSVECALGHQPDMSGGGARVKSAWVVDYIRTSLMD